jgi:hypothetical protein
MPVKIFIIAALLWGSLGRADDDASICDSFQDPGSDLRVRNCQALFADPTLIPNHDALVFSLKYFRDNYGGLQDPSCALASESHIKTPDHIEDNGILSDDQIKAGIHNKCQFVINDVNTRWPGVKSRSTAYYVDLCADKTQPGRAANPEQEIVQKFYMNVGYGPPFRDENHNKRLGIIGGSTLAGCFLTNNEAYDFQPYDEYAKNSKYKNLEASLAKQGLKLRGLRLVGLNSSNNKTEYRKPIHVSPFSNSEGCPSVEWTHLPFIEELAQNGPSLLVNYGPKSFHTDTKVCDNPGNPNEGAPPATTKRSTGK